MSEISFEYFDPEIELGTIHEHGKPIRPRKKPGRKPNPPSPTQRKAQNRAAQRAFRERKRKEMREAENNIKKCIYQRDQAIKKANQLQKSVKQLEYQCNYLIGMVLSLKLACFSHGINVPKFWNTGRIDAFGSDIISLSKTKNMPQNLEFFLDNKLHIISQSPEFNLSDHPSSQQQSSPSNMNSMNDLISQVLSNHQQQQSSFDITNQVQIQNNTNNNNIDHSSFFNLFDTSPKPTYWSSPSPSTQTHLSTSSFISSVNNNNNSNNNNNNNNNSNNNHPSPSSSPHSMNTIISNQYHTTSVNNHQNYHNSNSNSPNSQLATVTNPNLLSITSSISSTTSSPSSTSTINENNRQIFPPMSAIDAVNFITSMNNGKSFNESVYTPTELQRHVPHDARIDYVPGPLMRDHMIMFQGYYDANALFSFLISQSVFLGGDLGNPDCWFVPPSFFQTYWFLMPNHRPRRMDNAIEIAVNQGRTLSRMLFQRKKMYLQRDRFADYFPPIKDNIDDDDNNHNSDEDNGDIDIDDHEENDDMDDMDDDDHHENDATLDNHPHQPKKKQPKKNHQDYQKENEDDSILNNDDKKNIYLLSPENEVSWNNAIHHKTEVQQQQQQEDVTINAVMNLMETLPRLTTPNVFNF
ncbi:unnamed protein product [Cunninghamella blakesleeana]